MPVRVLIVEDDKHIRKILHSLLTHDATLMAHEVEVAQAQDGREALDQVEKGPFDLIISDLLMPRMDGFQFGRELRKHANGEKTALIITSAIYKNQAALAQLQRDVGPHQFFAKPFQLPEIVEAVRRGLKLTDKPAPSAKGPSSAVPAPPAVEPAPGPSAPPRPAPAPVAARAPAPPTPPAPAPAKPALAPAPAPAAAPPPMAMQGKLNERAPPRLFLEICERRLTGQLSVLRGKVKKSVVWVHGSPVAVESNLRTETLGHFLVLRGVIDEAKHQEAMAQASAAKERLGATLVRLGLLTETELMKQLGAQARSKLAGMVRWSEGDWTFVAGEPPTSVQTPMDCPRVVFAALQQTANAEQLAQQLAQLDARVVLSPRATRFHDAFVRVFGPTGWEAMAKRPLVGELIAGADPAPMLAQLDALLLCGLADLEAEAKSENIADDAVEPEPEELYDELFGPAEASQPTHILAAAPAPPPVAKAAPPPPPPAAKIPCRRAVAQSGAAAAGRRRRRRSPPPKPLAPSRWRASASRVERPDPAVEALRKEVLTEYLAGADAGPLRASRRRAHGERRGLDARLQREGGAVCARAVQRRRSGARLRARRGAEPVLSRGLRYAARGW